MCWGAGVWDELNSHNPLEGDDAVRARDCLNFLPRKMLPSLHNMRPLEDYHPTFPQMVSVVKASLPGNCPTRP